MLGPSPRTCAHRRDRHAQCGRATLAPTVAPARSATARRSRDPRCADPRGPAGAAPPERAPNRVGASAPCGAAEAPSRRRSRRTLHPGGKVIGRPHQEPRSATRPSSRRSNPAERHSAASSAAPRRENVERPSGRRNPCGAPVAARSCARPGRPRHESARLRRPRGGLHLVPCRVWGGRRNGQRADSKRRRPLHARGLRGRTGGVCPRLRARAQTRHPLQPRALGAERGPPRRSGRALARVPHAHERARGQARVRSNQMVAPRGGSDRANRRLRPGRRAIAGRRHSAGARDLDARRPERSPGFDRDWQRESTT